MSQVIYSISPGHDALPILCPGDIEVMDRFGTHLISEEANTLCFKSKIISLKEEVDSSSINQAYNKYFAKEDNRIQRKNLTFLRDSSQWNSDITDQWSLFHCFIAAVRYTTMHPHLWVNSFIDVNLKPTESIPFEEWCKKIAAHMQSSDYLYFLLENYNNIDKYLLLPNT